MKKETKSKEAQKEHKAPWQNQMATPAEVRAFLEDHVFLRHNVITNRVECRLPETDPFEKDWFAGFPKGVWMPISDRIVNTLWEKMSLEKRVRAEDMHRVIGSNLAPDYHPFRYYLDHLPPWDGDDYIMELSMSVAVKGGVDEQFRFAEYLRKWLVAMVAAWVDPTVVNNVILVLIGEQGSYKTTWFHYLLPEELRQYFYTKTNANRMGRDDLLTLAQYGLVCCEELDTMRPAELNQLKAAVTMPAIDERAAYAHYHEHRHHIASFCGTGNNVQFLSDPTGNRRWLPFEVDFIMSPRDNPLNYEAIYAQAYTLYRQGFQYWFAQDEIQRLTQYNRHFETPRLEAELVDVFFRKPVGVEPGEFMPVARAKQIVCGSMAHEISDVRLGRAFSELGFTFKRTKFSRGYIVVQRSSEEIRSRMQMLAVTDDG